MGLLTKRLERLGIDTEGAAIADQTATARGAQLLGGLGNMKTSARWFRGPQVDLLILKTGLVLVKIVGDPDTDEGNNRLRAVLGGAPLHEIAAAHRFVPFEDIRQVKIERGVPLRALITLHNGEVICLREPWTGDKLAKDSPKVLLELLSRYP
jgi:hypothetical protein